MNCTPFPVLRNTCLGAARVCGATVHDCLRDVCMCGVLARAPNWSVAAHPDACWLVGGHSTVANKSQGPQKDAQSISRAVGKLYASMTTHSHRHHRIFACNDIALSCVRTVFDLCRADNFSGWPGCVKACLATNGQESDVRCLFETRPSAQGQHDVTNIVGYVRKEFCAAEDTEKSRGLQPHQLSH